MSEMTSGWATTDLDTTIGQDKKYSWREVKCDRQGALSKGWPLSDEFSLPEKLLATSLLQPYAIYWQLEDRPCERSTSPGQSQYCAEFEEQKKAFSVIAADQLVRYTNEFVISRNGQIVDHDKDLSILTNRFFTRSGTVPVYITRVGGPLQVTLRTPPRRR
ncbi:MAG TPA: hypothetical protein VJX67_18590 [Blastocatellia bacterium]|nr:hypothetical protein [Blastocatellia bacterium]